MKKYILPIILIVLLTLTCFANASDLFGTYDKRIKITIDHTKIDSDLAWFPITVFLTSSQGEEVFTEFDADEDFDRIAFTSSDGETQLYADCELFDVSESKAIYHVSKTGWTVSSSTDTDIYLYYDNTAGHNTTYISKSGGTAAQSVWDSDFKAVYHMADPIVDYDTEYDGSALPTASAPAWTYSDNESQSESTYSSVSGGILTFDSTNVSKGQPEYSLSPDIDFDAGVYIKVRVKMDSASQEYTGLLIGVDDGTQNETTFFQIRDTMISHRTSGGSYSTYYKNTTADYHIYELYVKGTSSKLYMDGVLLGEESVQSKSVSDSVYFRDSSEVADAVLKCYIDYLNYALDIGYNPCGIIDATSNANHGTKKGANEPAEATGKVGQGQDFDGSNDYIALGGAIVSTHPFTIEAIARINDTNPRAIISVGDKDVSNKYYYIGVSSDKFALSVSNTSAITNLSANTYNDSNFHYVVGTFVDNTEKNLYVDIADKKTITNSVAVPPIDATEAGRICDSSPSNYYNDVVDEIRISNSERSDAWIAATYDSLWDTLLTYGSEETAPTGETTNVLFIFSNF